MRMIPISRCLTIPSIDAVHIQRELSPLHIYRESASTGSFISFNRARGAQAPGVRRKSTHSQVPSRNLEGLVAEEVPAPQFR